MSHFGARTIQIARCGGLGWAILLSVAVLGESICQTARAQIPPLQLELTAPSQTPTTPPPASASATSESAPSAASAAITRPTAAQENGTPEPDTLDTLLQQIVQRQQQLQTDSDQTPEAKEELTKSYEALRLDLEAAQKARQRRLENLEAAAAAPGLLEAAKARQAELQRKQSPASAAEIETLGYEELEQRRLELEAQLATVTAERTALSDATSRREKRRKELPQLISDAKSKLEQIDALAPPADGNANGELPQMEATRWSREVSRRLLSEQQQGYEAEQRLYEAEALLLPLKLEIAQTSEKRLQDRLRLINDRLEQLRADRIQNAFIQAQRLTVSASPELKPVGEKLLERIKSWMEMSSQQADLQEERETASELLTRWSERQKQMVARIEPKPGAEGVTNVISGFNSWVGLMLRKQRGELPEIPQLESKIRGYQLQMQSAESLLFDIEDGLQEIRLRQERIEDWEGDAEADATAAEATQDERFLQFAAETLQAITLDVNAYQDDLYELADIHETTIRRTQEYRDFIDKHVLWIRSAEPLAQGDWRPGSEALHWLVELENWRRTSELLGQDALRRLGWYILFLLVVLLLIANQSRLRRKLADVSAKAEKNSCVDYRLTARGLALTLLSVAPVPLILLFFHWRLSVAASTIESSWGGTDFQTALASGLWLTAVVFAPLELTRQLCRPTGLGIKHFGWDEKISVRLRTNLRWLIDFCLPLTLLVGIFVNHSVERWESSLGRVAFILGMPLLSLFFGRVLAPRTGIVSGFLEHHPGGWIDRLSWLWYSAHLIYPLVLAAVSFVGYHYTALRIAAHMVSTLWLVVLLAVAYHMLMRWLVISRRRLMLAQARQRLEEAARREPQQAETALAVEEPRVNLVAINEQTRRLVTSLTIALGLVLLFVIWADVLPAVSMLDGIRLWPLYGAITEETFTITLANVLLVIPLIVLFVIAGRNVPGLLEIAFLQHLPLTSAARYAITTLSRYSIFALAILVVSSMIGLQWKSIQWLVAALGVGLGFGLQEIFANFVSGIILLFEQPIRVGDIVSIDGTTGSVSKIRMRATTIVNWDRQELIVPNKDFITGKLLNWTLSDSTNRIVISVRVAYGSDPQRACDLIRQVCLDHENVMREPQPTVTFEGFGEDALNVTLRAFLDSLENRLQTVHQLHQQIYQTFNANGIMIAFPQRDLHIRSMPEKLSRWLEKSS